VTFQLGAKFGQMFMVPCLNCAKDIDCRNIRTGERAIVYHLFYARARRSDLSGEIGEATGTIADHSGESAEPSVGDQTPFNHATKHVGIDISAAK
jgi:hypothetical protein